MKKILFSVLFYPFIIIILFFNPISNRVLTVSIAKLNNLDSKIFYNQIKAESSFIPFQKSSRGAIGLGQIKLSTAKYIAPNTKKWALFFPPVNLHLSATYNKYLLKKYNNNWSLALAAYNWGETNVDTLLRKKKLTIKSETNYSNYFKNIRETYNYLNKILDKV